MTNELNPGLLSDKEAKQYYLTLPQYVKEAVKKHTDEIDSYQSLRLFAETFMEDDSHRGA